MFLQASSAFSSEAKHWQMLRKIAFLSAFVVLRPVLLRPVWLSSLVLWHVKNSQSLTSKMLSWQTQLHGSYSCISRRLGAPAE